MYVCIWVAIQSDDELLKQLIHIVYTLKRTESKAYTNAAAKQSSETAVKNTENRR